MELLFKTKLRNVYDLRLGLMYENIIEYVILVNGSDYWSLAFLNVYF